MGVTYVEIRCQTDLGRIKVEVEEGEDAEGECPICGGRLFVAGQEILDMKSARGMAGFVRCVVDPEPPSPPPEEP